MNLTERVKRGPSPTAKRVEQRRVPIWVERAQRVGLPIRDETPALVNGSWVPRGRNEAA